MMNERFDDLILTSDIVQGVIETCIRLFAMAFILMLVFSVFMKLSKFKIKIPIMWYFNLPKFFISLFAILLVFCYDYEEKHIIMFHFYDMTAATFFVGSLAIIEIIFTAISMAKEFIECNRK